MKSDRELLELAAKAASVEVEWRRSAGAYYYDDPETGREEWMPLYNDGQALRLAVKLNLLHGKVFARSVTEYHEGGDDIYAATRRAIVRAAAAIGELIQ